MAQRDARTLERLEEELVGRTDLARSASAGGVPEALLLRGLQLLIFVVFLFVWDRAADVVGEFWISRPSAVGGRLVDWITSGYLAKNVGITLQETAWGFLVGATAGIVTGFILGSSPFVGKLFDPYITAAYSLPKVALAPLFVLWFGIGIQMKVMLAATIVFFLVFWNTYAGVRDVNRELLDVLRVMGARPRHLILKVVLPSSLHWIYVGLKLSVPYALIGAIVGELVASNSGLGYILQFSAGQFDTAGLMAALVVLLAISLTMNEVLNRTEAKFLRWKAVDRDR